MRRIAFSAADRLRPALCIVVLAFLTAAVVLVVGGSPARADTTSWKVNQTGTCRGRIATDVDGNVYVEDGYSGRVQKYTGTGVLLGAVGPHAAPFGLARAGDVGVYIGYFSSGVSHIVKYDRAGNQLHQPIDLPFGNGDHQASNILAIGADGAGNIYVLDPGGSTSTWKNRVVKFSSDGTYLTQWGQNGEGDQQFNFLHGSTVMGTLAVAEDGTVYVVDATNRVQKFTSDGQFISSWQSTGAGPGQFWGISAIVLDSAGHVYVGDPYPRQTGTMPNGLALQQFDTAWNFLASSNDTIGQISGLATYGDNLVYGYNCDTVYRFELTTPTPPSMSLSASSVRVGDSLTVSASASVPFGAISNYAFDFGDGTAGASGPAATATHSYAGAGTYQVGVRLMSSRGGSVATSKTVTVMPALPANGSLPAIVGTAVEGQRLTEVHGAWRNGPVTRYYHQWQRCDTAGNNCATVPGASAQTYVLTDRDVGRTMRVTERVMNAGGSGQTVTSSPTAIVKALAKLRSLSISPQAFRAARGGNSVTVSPKGGADVRYKLNIKASVRIVIQRAADGRRVRARCDAPSRKNQKAQRCTRYLPMRGSITVAGRAGNNSFRFSGRLNGSALAYGSYVLIATPSANGASGKSQTATFRITR